MDDPEDLIVSYVVPEGDAHPIHLFNELIELDEHKHFADAEIPVEFLLRVAPKIKAGRMVLGTAMIPTVQGLLKDLFEQLLGQFFGRMPLFLIVLDRDFWMEADAITRAALLEHEMMHIKQDVDKNGDLRFDRDGNPVFGIVGHDLEEFNYIVNKYGRWKSDIGAFLDAAEGK